jgi:NAD(P)-dependent dehydrogenase (short-subunit alcohol dehydrogenase family)
VLALPLDVTDRAQVFAAVEEAVERFGRLDVVLNNAGYGQWGMVEELTEHELRDQMETNFFGAVWVTQAVLPVLRRQRAGHLVQVTSEGGVRAYPGIGAYHASKWALEGLSESLAQETAVFGFHVTALEPGAYATGFGGAIHASAESTDYRESRDAQAGEFSFGDPAATVPALFRLVDSERPPRRLILGTAVADMVAIYEERIRVWREWEDVSLAAFGAPLPSA